MNDNIDRFIPLAFNIRDFNHPCSRSLKKNWLPWMGFEPTTLHSVRCSYQLSYRGSSGGWAESHIQIKAKYHNLISR